MQSNILVSLEKLAQFESIQGQRQQEDTFEKGGHYYTWPTFTVTLELTHDEWSDILIGLRWFASRKDEQPQQRAEVKAVYDYVEAKVAAALHAQSDAPIKVKL